MNIQIFINSKINSIFPDDIYSELAEPVSELFPSTQISVPKYLVQMKQIDTNSLYDYIGVCPGNYHFTKFDFPVSKPYLQELFQSYDVILPFSSTVKGNSLKELYFSLSKSSSDLSLLGKIIASHYPNYVTSYERVINHQFLSTDCMLITSQKNYHNLITWLYDVLYIFAKETRALPSEINLCLELLLRTYFTGQTLRIKEESVRKNDINLYENIIQKTELILKYIRLRSEPVIAECRQTNFGSLVLPEVECKDDFEGKIPIWFCWWQGKEEMPLLTKVCTESMRKHFPQDKVCFRFITLENCQEYVSFTDAVITKFNEGKITLTELSDILRSELLYRYGGLWIDATIFVTRDLPADFWDQDFFSLAFHYSIFGYDIPRSRWTPSLWYMKSGNPLARFLLEAFWHYWEIEDELIHYFLLDHFIAIAYEEFPEIKTMIDSCVVSPATIYDLQLQVNQQYSATKWKSIEDASIFYKLNRRNTYKELTENQSATIFHHMCEITETSEIDIINSELSEPIILDVLPNSNVNNILTSIQSYNPRRVLDCGMYFNQIGAISLMALRDTIFHEFIVDAIPSETSILTPIDHTIYHTIHSGSCPVDEIKNKFNNYDLILLSGDYITT